MRFVRKEDLDVVKDKSILKHMSSNTGDQVSQSGNAGKIHKTKRYIFNSKISIHSIIIEFKFQLSYQMQMFYSTLTITLTIKLSIGIITNDFIGNSQILTGNMNTYSEVENILQPIIVASKVRIYPYSQYDRTVCLRVELVGCPWTGKFSYIYH